MIRLLYISQAAPNLGQLEIEEIMKTSKKNNLIADLTGVLVCGGNMFMQILEGPEESVLKRYVKIIDDKRHSNCEIISISYVKTRMFERWSMGLINSNLIDYDQISELRAVRQETIEAKVFVDIMRQFVRLLSEN